MKEILNQLLLSTPNASRRTRIIGDRMDICKYLNNRFPNAGSLKEQLFLFENPKISFLCSCGNHRRFINGIKGYAPGCSRSCPDTKANRSKTMKSIWDSRTEKEKELIAENRKATVKKHYGVDNPFQDKDIKKSIKTTMLYRYGVSHPAYSPEITERRKATLDYRYGVDNPMKSSEIRARAKETNLDRYGVSNPLQSKTIRKQICTTNENRHGYTNPFMSEEIQNQIQQTNLKRYGTIYPMQNSAIQDKVSATNLTKYGVPNPMMDTNIKNIHKKAIIKHRDESFSEYTTEVLSSKHLLKAMLDETGSYTGVANKLGDVCYQTIARHAESMGISHETWVPQGEVEIRSFLNELNIEYETNTRSVIPPKELDFYIPQCRLAIEYCGLYWHSDKFKQSSYHQDKLVECEKLGIQLITIFEDEWLSKKDIVKSILLLKLNQISNTISARPCDIIKGKTDMFDRFHIMNRTSYSIAYSLIHNNIEVASMSFSQNNPARSETGWAIDRYVSIPGTIIQDGGLRLFSAFAKDHPHIEQVMTFADARYGTGMVYEEMGFTRVGLTAPGYWYIEDNFTKRTHRYSYTKKNLMERFGGDPSHTERELALEQGMYRIYDCGHHRFRWERS